MKYYQILELARKLRRNQTEAEKKLWRVLRNRKLDGKKFTRQHPVIYEVNKSELFFFIPDFFCSEHKLVIELDGEIHQFEKEKDKIRTIHLNNHGFEVIRFTNDEILSSPEKAVQRIKIHLDKRTE